MQKEVIVFYQILFNIKIISPIINLYV